METLQESISKLNQDKGAGASEPVPGGSGGGTTAPAPSPAPKPAEGAKPGGSAPVPPAGKEKQPQIKEAAKAATIDREKNKSTPATPKIVDKGSGSPDPNADGGEEQGAGEKPIPGGQPSAEDKQPDHDSIFSESLSSLTDGHLKSKDDLVGLLQHYNELVAQVEAGVKPKFTDERAELAHRILSAHPGTEPQAAMRTLRALNFEFKGKDDKDILFEAYLLRPENADLTERRAQGLFEAEYQSKYGDLDPKSTESAQQVIQRKLELEVKEATASIKKVQGEFSTAEEQPRQITKEVESSVKKAIDRFGGIKIAFSDNPQESDYLTIPVDDPKVLAAIQNNALNPEQEWASFIKQFETENGFDYPNYVRAMYERTHAEEIRQIVYDHAFKMGQLSEINRLKNASNGKSPAQFGTPGPAKAPGSIEEAWAAKVAG